LIGSVIGVGLMNQIMGGVNGTSGVDWGQATKIGYSLLASPVFGFVLAGGLLYIMKGVVKVPTLYKAPEGNKPPPFAIRALLVFTCTLVSFFHGSNDGQKGMGLIMLILVGTVPLSYALNRAMPDDQMSRFAAVAQVTQQSIVKAAPGQAPADPRAALTDYIRTHAAKPETLPALAAVTGSIGDQVRTYGTLAKVPSAAVSNVRNDMYLASEAIRLVEKDKAGGFDDDGKRNLKAFRQEIDTATKFIPLWVKVAVAIALGLGTMVGWKRIVVTVGEKIGKTHLTYAQGASAEMVAMLTIGAADMYGLPVSTTHVLSSGVAGTMAANRSGLQMSTLRNLMMAWVLTLPAAILLSGSLYWLFTRIF
jgi:PiT family inorganic phosphate transporter